MSVISYKTLRLHRDYCYRLYLELLTLILHSVIFANLENDWFVKQMFRGGLKMKIWGF